MRAGTRDSQANSNRCKQMFTAGSGPRCAASDPARSKRLFLDKRSWVGRLPLVATLIGIAQASRTTSERRRRPA